MMNKEANALVSEVGRRVSANRRVLGSRYPKLSMCLVEAIEKLTNYRGGTIDHIQAMKDVRWIGVEINEACRLAGGHAGSNAASLADSIISEVKS